MNKKSIILSLALVFCLLFTGCGASAEYSANAASSSVAYSSGAEMTEDMLMEVPSEEISAGAEASVSDRKIIRTAEIDLETLYFEETLGKLQQSVEASGGYIESSNYNVRLLAGNNLRYCSMTVRVPDGDYTAFLDSLGEYGNIRRRYETSEDVTTQYYDTESRIRALEIQQERLFAMLEKAEDVETMLLIEQQLAEVNYQLDSFNTTLKGIDRQVDYATIHIGLEEVVNYTEEEPVDPTLGERIAMSFSDSLEAMGEFLEGSLVVAVAVLPFLLLLAIPAAVIVIIAVAVHRRRVRKAAAKAVAAEKDMKE